MNEIRRREAKDVSSFIVWRSKERLSLWNPRETIFSPFFQMLLLLLLFAFLHYIFCIVCFFSFFFSSSSAFPPPRGLRNEKRGNIRLLLPADERKKKRKLKEPQTLRTNISPDIWTFDHNLWLLFTITMNHVPHGP